MLNVSKLRAGISNRTESPSIPQGFVGAGGSGLDGLLHSDTLRQTVTDEQGTIL